MIDYQKIVVLNLEAIKELKQEKDTEIQELKQLVCLDHPTAPACQ